MGTARYVVHGPCYVMVDVGNGLEVLGMTRDGAEITVTRHKRPIMTDALGPAVPSELQAMGAEASIGLLLATWDPLVLSPLLALATGRTAAGSLDGTMGEPGALIGTGDFAVPLYLPAASEDPWYFPTTTIQNPDSVKVGTEANPKSITFYAWPFIAGSDLTALSKVLYTRTAP